MNMIPSTATRILSGLSKQCSKFMQARLYDSRGSDVSLRLLRLFVEIIEHRRHGRKANPMGRGTQSGYS